MMPRQICLQPFRLPLYLVDVEKQLFMIFYVSFESVFPLTTPSEDFPEHLAAVGKTMGQSDARRKRLLV